MSWTDERIERLQKLWLQGMSASKIANELANGLTRNAVIGKVYRLGLSGRTKADDAPAAPQAPRPVRPHVSRPAQHGSHGQQPAHRSAPQSHGARGHAAPSHAAQTQMAQQMAQNAGFVRGNTALAVQPIAFAAPAPVADHEVVVPISEPVTIVDLRDSMCRWPIGDPTQPDFRFCGARKTPGEGPYCGCHAAIAYQPQPDRRRARPPKSS